MYIVNFRQSQEPTRILYIEESQADTLFALLWIFEQAEKLLVYTVSMNGTMVYPRHFGWGHMNKWRGSLYDTS